MGHIWRLVLLHMCAPLWACALGAAHAHAYESTLPDYLEAENAEYTSEGLVRAFGGATFYITSLIENGTIIVTADDAEYDTINGVAELWGNVKLALEGNNLGAECDYLYYDPLMERLEVYGVMVDLPLYELLGESYVAEAEPRAEFPGHIYSAVPRVVLVAAGEASFELDARSQAFVMRNVRLSHSSRRDPDLFLYAKEIRFGSGDKLAVYDSGVSISGWRLFTWPSLSRRIPPRPGWYGFEFPQISVDRDTGLSWKQQVNLDFDAIKVNSLLDYSTDTGVLADGFAYTEPFPGAKLGVQYGTRREVDLHRVNIERRAEYNYIYRQLFKGEGWLQRLKVDFEYGRMVVHSDAQPEKSLPAQRIEDTRMFAYGDVEFEAVPLAGGLYMVYGGSYKRIEYEDAGEEYRVAGGRIGLVWPDDGFNHFVLYRLNDISGEPVFTFDEEREQQLDFATSFRLHPSWRHVVQGIYDFDEDELDRLQVGILKRQRSYEIGLYWDLARESGGLELGLFTD